MEGTRVPMSRQCNGDTAHQKERLNITLLYLNVISEVMSVNPRMAVFGEVFRCFFPRLPKMLEHGLKIGHVHFNLILLQ
jgi:hypothetical protein